jgi:hypothetical protein
LIGSCDSSRAWIVKATGVAKANTAARGVLVAHLSISWAMDMQAAIVHVDAALSALNSIHTTGDKLEIERNLEKSSL